MENATAASERRLRGIEAILKRDNTLSFDAIDITNPALRNATISEIAAAMERLVQRMANGPERRIRRMMGENTFWSPVGTRPEEAWLSTQTIGPELIRIERIDGRSGFGESVINSLLLVSTPFESYYVIYAKQTSPKRVLFNLVSLLRNDTVGWFMAAKVPRKNLLEFKSFKEETVTGVGCYKKMLLGHMISSSQITSLATAPSFPVADPDLLLLVEAVANDILKI